MCLFQHHLSLRCRSGNDNKLAPVISCLGRCYEYELNRMEGYQQILLLSRKNEEGPKQCMQIERSKSSNTIVLAACSDTLLTVHRSCQTS